MNRRVGQIKANMIRVRLEVAQLQKTVGEVGGRTAKVKVRLLYPPFAPGSDGKNRH